MTLNSEQRERYARQLSLPEIGESGQARLGAARVLVVGVGGLGSPAAFYLAAAGVGTVGIADGDRVDLSNLQRQILHATQDVGRLKVESAVGKLLALNPDIRVQPHAGRFTRENAEELLSAYDFVIDATDNFASKFMIADVCHALKKPYSHAGIIRFMGQTMTVLPGRTACCRCVFENEPPENDDKSQGPLGSVAGVLGAIQATEAVKFILGIGELLTDALLVCDVLDMTFRRLQVQRNDRCPLCGSRGN